MDTETILKAISSLGSELRTEMAENNLSLRSETKLSADSIKSELRSEIKSSADSIKSELRSEIKSSADSIKSELRSEMSEKFKDNTKILRSEMKQNTLSLRAEMKIMAETAASSALGIYTEKLESLFQAQNERLPDLIMASSNHERRLNQVEQDVSLHGMAIKKISAKVFAG